MIKVGDTGDAPVRERAAQDQETRLAALELEQAADAPFGDERAHGVLRALQRGDADQELMRHDAREIVVQVPGRDYRIDVALLHLQRDAVLEMRDERVIERGAGLDPAALGELARGAHRLERQYLEAMLVAAGADLIRNVTDLERMGVYALLGDEGADAGDTHEYAVG